LEEPTTVTTLSPIKFTNKVFIPKAQNQPVRHVSHAQVVEDYEDEEPLPLDLDLMSRMCAELVSNKCVCLVCTDIVGRNHSIWHCESCYAIFHLGCIISWSVKCQDHIHDPDYVPDFMEKEWRCPHCNFIYIGRAESRCFCGSQVSPEINDFITPHSCGNTCARKRNQFCPHPCPLACHPGPCPPCSALGGKQYCFCGAKEYQGKCGEDPSIKKSCGEPCEKILNCGFHYCSALCHDGECEKCSVETEQKCYCGKEVKMGTCGSEVIDRYHGEERHFSCASICGRTFSCEVHKCNRRCHPGSCGECALSPSQVTTCHCGKSDLLFLGAARKKCTDPIPGCSEKCGKTMSCQMHYCPKKCHSGDCGDCRKTVTISCSCGFQKKRMACFKAYPSNSSPKEYKCRSVCGTLRSCGRHQCNRRCCPGKSQAGSPEHECELICNKNLNCGNHKCESPCHKGRCPPCSAVTTYSYCGCGLSPSVAMRCGSIPPLCPYPCNRSLPCGHPNPTHPCHPPDTPCPACLVLVDKWCVGKHMVIYNVRCSTVEITCGRTCDRLLGCGHLCASHCHKNDCSSLLDESLPTATITSNGVTATIKSCGQCCNRRLGCGHCCPYPCHPASPCIEKCVEKMWICCACRRLKKEIECFEFFQQNTKVLPCNKHCASPINFEVIYSQKLYDLCEVLPLKFILYIEKTFGNLINDTKITSHSFEAMNKNKRHFIYALTKNYGLKATSYDKEPYCSVVVTKDTFSKVPPILFSMAYQTFIEKQNQAQQIGRDETQPWRPPSLTTQKQELRKIQKQKQKQNDDSEWQTVPSSNPNNTPQNNGSNSSELSSIEVVNTFDVLSLE